MAVEVGYRDSQELFSRLRVPHPHIVVTASGKQFWRVSTEYYGYCVMYVQSKLLVWGNKTIFLRLKAMGKF